MSWIKKLFTRKVSYMYFKRVTDSFYGMCGTQRLHLKTECARGRFSYMQDMLVAHHMEVKGWEEIGKEEYENAPSNTQRSL